MNFRSELASRATVPGGHCPPNLATQPVKERERSEAKRLFPEPIICNVDKCSRVIHPAKVNNDMLLAMIVYICKCERTICVCRICGKIAASGYYYGRYSCIIDHIVSKHMYEMTLKSDFGMFDAVFRVNDHYEYLAAGDAFSIIPYSVYLRPHASQLTVSSSAYEMTENNAVVATQWRTPNGTINGNIAETNNTTAPENFVRLILENGCSCIVCGLGFDSFPPTDVFKSHFLKHLPAL